MHGTTAQGAGAPGGRTRRGLFATALGTGAAGALAAPLLAEAAAPESCAPDPPGFPTGPIAVTPDGRAVWTTDVRGTTITRHSTRSLKRGRAIDVGGAPRTIAVARHGRLALVTTAAFDHPGLALVDLVDGGVARLEVGPDPGAVVITRDGSHAHVVGRGAEGTLVPVELRERTVGEAIALGAHPRGIALLPDGKRAVVALNGSSEVVVVELATGAITRRIPTTAFPTHVAVSPDGRRGLVTHNGVGARAVTPLDLVAGRAQRPIRVGADPAGVAFARKGRLAVVTAAGSGEVTVLETGTWRRRRTSRPGGEPRAVAVTGTRAVVADARTGRLRVLRLGAAA